MKDNTPQMGSAKIVYPFGEIERLQAENSELRKDLMEAISLDSEALKYIR